MKYQYQSFFHQVIKWDKLILLVTLLIFAGCQKDFLDKKPDRSKLVPVTIADFQAMLDYSLFFTSPGLQEISADDFYTTDAGLSPMSVLQVNAYTWSPSIFAGVATIADWSIPYQQVFTANVVLEGLEAFPVDAQASQDYKSLKGTAFFYRSFAFYNLSQLFAPPYESATADRLPGIALRLVSDVNARPPRATVKQTYDQILQDLQTCLPLLPDQVVYKNRPSKSAALAMLARVYLSMGDYTNAGLYADKALQLHPGLLDYSSIKWNATDRLFPSALPNGNAEVIYYRGLSIYSFPTSSALAGVDQALYSSYANDDLRKSLFFRDRGNGFFTIRGTYGGPVNPALFGGLATDELYLIRAECAARKGDLGSALADINKLLSYRWQPGKYVDYNSNDRGAVLSTILLERRKELIGRGLRWTDLRRLNLDPKYKIDLQRTVKDKTYILPANSSRYTFPIPDDEVLAGMQQNP
jgi:tetratricopeptide (TPR) repeat protein